MSWLKDLRFLRVIPWLILFFAIPAFAQFEVSPDHFDSSETNKAMHQTTTKNKAKAAQSVTLPARTQGAATTVAATSRRKRNIRCDASGVASLPPKRIDGQTSPRVDRVSGAYRKRAPATPIAAVSPTMDKQASNLSETKQKAGLSHNQPRADWPQQPAQDQKE